MHLHRNAKISRFLWIFLVLAGGSLAPPVLAQHTDLFIGHSPPPDAPESEGCPTQEPLRLFIADNEAVGGDIPPGGGEPADPGVAIELAHIAFGDNLAAPARGGFVFGLNDPGLNYIDTSDPCHGMSTDFTGGQFFETFMERIQFVDGVNFAMTQAVTPILNEDGTNWKVGDSANGGHIHPFFLAHRPGAYLAEFQMTASIVFTPSEEFTLSFKTSPECFAATPVDLTGVFNADVVDSDLSDSPSSFDGAGHYWLLDGLYGTDRGIPADGTLDLFQLQGLTGSNLNCLFDDGSLTSAATIDLVGQGIEGSYLSAELLIGASGDFECLTGETCETLVVRMVYDTGSEQVVNIRRLPLPAGFDPVYVPVNNWRVSGATIPRLSVGPSGSREGGGFERSDGSGIDMTLPPFDSFYLQRVTFPLDQTRMLESIEIDDYTDTGRIALFAVTLLAEEECGALELCGDVNANSVVNIFDIFCVLSCIEGSPSSSCDDAGCELTDLEPCGGNGTLNIFDVFAILNGVNCQGSGDPECCCSAP